MWVLCGKRQPPAAGEYRVIRRGIRHELAAAYEDECGWTPPDGDFPRGAWKNRRGTVIRTVEKWWEDENDGE